MREKSKGSAWLLSQGAPDRNKCFLCLQPLRNLLLPIVVKAGHSPLLALYCSMSCWVINSPDHRQDKGQVAVLALLQTVSPHDDHTWSPSCCCSCPSATLAQSLFSRREPPFTRAETPVSLQDCAHSHTCCHAYMGHFCMSLEEPGGCRLSALGYHLPSASFW